MRVAALTGVVCIVFACGACERTAPPLQDTASAPQVVETTALAAPTPTPMLTECGRIEAEGFVFSIASDTLGNVLTTTKRGRAAAYLISAGAGADAAPAGIELEDYATALGPVARGVFALGVGESVLVVAAQQQDGSPTLQTLFSVEVGGRPAAFAAAGGLLWVAVRGTPTEHGLLAIAPESGTIVHRLESGPTPIELLAAPPGGAGQVSPPATTLWMLAMRGEDAGRIVRVSIDAGAPPRVVQGELPAVPLRLVDPGYGGDHVFVVLHNTRGVLPIARRSLTPTSLLDLDFAPQSLLGADGEQVLYAVAGSGSLVRMDMGPFAEKAGPPSQQRQQVSLRTSEIALAADHGDLLMLDAEARAVVLLQGGNLERLATLEVGATLGRMATDSARQRAYVTLPERGEVLCVEWSGRP